MQKLVQQRTEMLKSMPKLLGPISVKVSDVHTGAWRYRRPVVRDNDCVRCGICAEYCPCGVIENTNDKVVIDYTYCKGCGICTVECPKKAIDFVLVSDCERECE